MDTSAIPAQTALATRADNSEPVLGVPAVQFSPDGRNILEVRVEEASSKSKDGTSVWDREITEGFVKAEIRGPPGSKPTKGLTQTVKLKEGSKLIWHQTLHLPLDTASSELRLLLCRDRVNKVQGGTTRRSTTVVTACGIYVKDVIEAVPIDKYFEMFKPGTGADGGFIRLKMRLVTQEEADQAQREAAGEAKTGKVLARVQKVLVLGAVLAASVFTYKRVTG